MSLRGALLTQDLGCGARGNAAVSCGSHLSSQRPPARNIFDADLSCGVVLLTQHPPARHIVDADLSCEAPFYTRGARGSDSRGHGSSQARRPEWGTMTHRSVRTEVLIFFGLGIRLLLYFFDYVSTKEPVAQMVARITV
jgi:hypothetical protein